MKLSKNPVKESNFLLLLGLSVWVLQNCTSEIVFRLSWDDLLTAKGLKEIKCLKKYKTSSGLGNSSCETLVCRRWLHHFWWGGCYFVTPEVHAEDDVEIIAKVTQSHQNEVVPIIFLYYLLKLLLASHTLLLRSCKCAELIKHLLY